jgi:hypothetical protein
MSEKSKVLSRHPYPAWQLVQRASLLWMLTQSVSKKVI